MANQQQIICSWVQGFPDVSAGKESACNAADIKDTVLMPGLGRSPRGANGNPLLYSCLKKSMDRV